MRGLGYLGATVASLQNLHEGDGVAVRDALGRLIGIGKVVKPRRFKTKVQVVSMFSIAGHSVSGEYDKFSGASKPITKLAERKLAAPVSVEDYERLAIDLGKH